MTNLVQWLPRDRGTGEQRLRIKHEDCDRDYNLEDRTHLPSKDIYIYYFDKKMQIVWYYVTFNDRMQAIRCTCEDHKNRNRPCKHMLALQAALKHRRKPIEFV